MNDSPAVILYDQNGNPVTLREGTLIEGYQPVLLMAGKDEDGYVKIFETTNGALSVNVNNPITVDGYVSLNEPVTVEGSISIDGPVTVDGYVGIEGVVQVAPAPLRAVEGRYFASTDLISGSNSSQLLATLENPVGSGKTIYITYLDINGLASVNNFSSMFLYRLRRLTALPTGGTVIVSEIRSTSDNPNSGIIREAPMGTPEAGNFWVGSAGTMRGSKPNRPKGDNSFETDLEDKEILLQEGEAVGIFADANSNNWRHYANLRWNEV